MHVTLATIRAVIHSLNAADIQVELKEPVIFYSSKPRTEFFLFAAFGPAIFNPGFWWLKITGSNSMDFSYIWARIEVERDKIELKFAGEIFAEMQMHSYPTRDIIESSCLYEKCNTG